MKTTDPLQKEVKIKGKKRRLINKGTLLLNHFAVMLLLISYLAPFVSPENFWFLSFFGLAYPILLIINILFSIYWLLQLKFQFFYSFLIVCAGWIFIERTVQIKAGVDKVVEDSTFRVMSYNVKVFDLYNWTQNKETRKRIFDLIKEENPAIACFQEYFHRDNSPFSNTDSLKKMNNWNAHVRYSATVKDIHHWGLATFSKYPIVGTGEVSFPEKGNNTCIFTDLQVGSDTFRIYNMHLQSIAFTKTDYKFAEDLQENKETEEIENSRNIFRRLKRAFIKRSGQADLIAESIKSSPYPVIVCGDFNDTPTSYTYNTISEGLEDAFIESGSGIGKSYNGSFPSFRIDYILYSKIFRSYNFRTLKRNLSDHFPVITEIQKK